MKELSIGCVNMELKKVAESYNLIFKRKELSFFIDHTSSSSPQLYEVKKSLAAKHNTSEDVVFVIKLNTKAGTNRTYGKAEIYDSSEIAGRIVPKYIQIRNTPKRHEKKEAKS